MHFSRFLKMALILGLLSAIGPFAIDMYLPALPDIGRSLGATTAQVQASLMAFFIAMGAGQLIYGPVSDMVGRKAPLYFGLVLFAAGSVASALAAPASTAPSRLPHGATGISARSPVTTTSQATAP